MNWDFKPQTSVYKSGVISSIQQNRLPVVLSPGEP